MQKWILIFGLFIILPVFFRPAAMAFLRDQDEEAVINALNELQLKGAFEGHGAVSFDSVKCSKSSRSCLVDFRAVDPSSEFGSIRSAKCIVEDMSSAHDVVDESEKNKSKDFYPMTKHFYQAVRNCQGVMDSADY